MVSRHYIYSASTTNAMRALPSRHYYCYPDITINTIQPRSMLSRHYYYPGTSETTLVCTKLLVLALHKKTDYNWIIATQHRSYLHCVCVHTYICVSVCACACIRMCACTRVCLRATVISCAYVCTQVHAYEYVRACLRMRMHVCV